MDSGIRFETPENVSVSYETAGLGTRFVAWFVDTMIFWIGVFVIFILLAIAGCNAHGVEGQLDSWFGDMTPGGEPVLPFLFLGIFLLVVGLGSFVYFGVSELLLSGQTLGKRYSKIRVVKADGFSLDAGSVLIRNIFRIIDHVPLLWIVPLVTTRSQRLGDLVAGTYSGTRILNALLPPLAWGHVLKAA